MEINHDTCIWKLDTFRFCILGFSGPFILLTVKINVDSCWKTITETCKCSTTATLTLCCLYWRVVSSTFMSLTGDIDPFSQYSCWDPPLTTNSLICIWGSSQWPIGNQRVSSYSESWPRCSPCPRTRRLSLSNEDRWQVLWEEWIKMKICWDFARAKCVTLHGPEPYTVNTDLWFNELKHVWELSHFYKFVKSNISRLILLHVWMSVCIGACVFADICFKPQLSARKTEKKLACHQRRFGLEVP